MCSGVQNLLPRDPVFPWAANVYLSVSAVRVLCQEHSGNDEDIFLGLLKCSSAKNHLSISARTSGFLDLVCTGGLEGGHLSSVLMLGAAVNY